MLLRHLWLSDFRSYREAELSPSPGLTAVLGANGQGKTNLLEAVGYLAALSSFRGAPTEAMIRNGCTTATVRAEGEREGRDLLIEAEIALGGKGRVQVNRQRLTRTRDLLGALRVSVFAPDDLELVKGGPVLRRGYLDDALVAARPKLDPVRTEVDRVLRQRNALLRQAGGLLGSDVESTLDVWDAKLTAAGETLAAGRTDLLDVLAPALSRAYRDVAHKEVEVGARYVSTWMGSGLAAALEDSRRDDLRRGVTLVGPHRDELELSLGGLPARTHASQGEQRSLALALRLAAHEVVTAAAGSPPVLLLDDVFSELDEGRSEALLASLPPGQTLLSSAAELPRQARPDMVLVVEGGSIRIP